MTVRRFIVSGLLVALAVTSPLEAARADVDFELELELAAIRCDAPGLMVLVDYARMRCAEEHARSVETCAAYAVCKPMIMYAYSAWDPEQIERRVRWCTAKVRRCKNN